MPERASVGAIMRTWQLGVSIGGSRGLSADDMPADQAPLLRSGAPRCQLMTPDAGLVFARGVAARSQLTFVP